MSASRCTRSRRSSCAARATRSYAATCRSDRAAITRSSARSPNVERNELIRSTLSSPCRSGKRVRSGRSQLPMHRRSPAAGRLGHRPGDHAGLLERIEMLSQRGVGEPELGGEVGRGRRLDALQAVRRSGAWCRSARPPAEFYLAHALFRKLSPCIIVASAAECSDRRRL